MYNFYSINISNVNDIEKIAITHYICNELIKSVNLLEKCSMLCDNVYALSSYTTADIKPIIQHPSRLSTKQSLLNSCLRYVLCFVYN